MTNIEKPVRSVGDIVAYQFDTGALGLTTLWGEVVAAGAKTFTIRWESGVKNRLSQGDRRISLVTDPETIEEARRSFLRAASTRKS